MKKSNKHIRSVSNHTVRNHSVFVPLSAGFCATALAITGGVVANASAASSVAGASSSVAASSGVVKSSAAAVAKKSHSVGGGYQILIFLLFSLLQLLVSLEKKPLACLAVRLKFK